MNSISYSIIIPVYNVDRYLRQCLDSIMSQSIKNFEVILVDDGSVDKSASICDEYAAKDSRFIVIHKKNEGASIARNIGITMSRGEWISFVDSDDFVTPFYLQQFSDLETKADINYFPHSIYFDDNGISKEYSLDTYYSCNREEMEKLMVFLKRENPYRVNYYGYTWNKFFRSSIIKKHNITFIPGLFYKEDELFVSRFIKYASTISIFGKPAYIYRQTHLLSVSTKFHKPDSYKQYIDGKMNLISGYHYKPLIRIEKAEILENYLLLVLSERNLYKCYKSLYKYIQYASSISEFNNIKPYLQGLIFDHLVNYKYSIFDRIYVISYILVKYLSSSKSRK